MPARVEYRLGSIFDEECDFLVIPSSAGGTVTPSMAEQLRELGIEFPTAMPVGSVTRGISRSPKFRFVLHAATVHGQTTTAEIVRGIGRRVGMFAAGLLAPRISSPLLGTGSGDLPLAVAAKALISGFLETAPEEAMLTINIRRSEVFETLLGVGAASPTLGHRVRVLPSRHSFDAKGERQALPQPLNPRQTTRDLYPISPPPPDVASTLRFCPDSSCGVRIPDGYTICPRCGRPLDPSSSDRPPSPLPETVTPRGSALEASSPPTANHFEAVPVEKPVPSEARTRVFISYSHEDAEWLERLQKHLAPLEREGALVWDDTRLKAGAQWREEIRGALAETKVAILLVSADFLASDFIATDELPPLLQAAAEDGATILPVIISPCRFERMESLSRFQSVNDPRKPLVKLRRGNREEVLDAVARAVEDALKR